MRDVLTDIAICSAIILTANAIACSMVLAAYAMTWHWGM